MYQANGGDCYSIHDCMIGFCVRYMEVAAIVSGINPSVNLTMDSVELASLQQVKTLISLIYFSRFLCWHLTCIIDMSSYWHTIRLITVNSGFEAKWTNQKNSSHAIIRDIRSKSCIFWPNGLEKIIRVTQSWLYHYTSMQLECNFSGFLGLVDGNSAGNSSH